MEAVITEVYNYEGVVWTLFCTMTSNLELVVYLFRKYYCRHECVLFIWKAYRLITGMTLVELITFHT